MSKTSITILAIGCIIAGLVLILDGAWTIAISILALCIAVAFVPLGLRRYRAHRDYENALWAEATLTITEALEMLKRQDDHLKGNPNDN